MFWSGTQQIVNSEEELARALMEIHSGITRDQTVKIIGGYRRAKAIKLEAGTGRILVKEERIWKPDVIRRAVELVERSGVRTVPIRIGFIGI